MALTDTDLRAVLAERAAGTPAERAAGTPADSAVARVAAVDKRVRVIRRRRATGASLAVVVVLLVVTGLGGLLRDGRDRSALVPAHLQKVAGGLLPRYTGGGEATAYTTFQTDEKRETTFTFTPTSLAFMVATACDKDMPESQMVSYDVNGHSYISGSCSRGPNTAGPSYGLEQARATELGLKVGVPATVRVRVVQITKGSSAPDKEPVYRGAMKDYRVAAAVYTPMSIADYPFPPRPHKLASLDDTSLDNGGRLLDTVDARSVGANGHAEVTETLPAKGIQVEMYAVAPGTVTVTVNGQTIDHASFWTWAGSGYGGLVLTSKQLKALGVQVKTGDPITVGLTGTRFAVPGWRAEVREGK